MSTIVVSGGTGFLGRSLIKNLRLAGNEVVVLSRNNNFPQNTKYSVDYNKSIAPNKILNYNEIKTQGLPQCDSLISLSGQNIAKKLWTEPVKKQLYDSRIGINNLLKELVEKSQKKPKVFIGTSAVGIYPTLAKYSEESSPVFYEESQIEENKLKGFAQRLCFDWEKSINQVPAERTAIVRTGIVIGPDGGIFKELYKLHQYNFGCSLGSGLQPFPWIQIQDWVGIIEHLLANNNLNGVFNANSPYVVTNHVFTTLFGNYIGSPISFQIKDWILRLLLREMSSILLEGTFVLPQKTLESGYKFRFLKIEDALLATMADF
eukprot:TRINITY_DN1439_c1_g1_i1.p1 TRINITY_DN1439_c1_g1~~TRINITY_DN1439_c1_g1_i1.p1  ORF type:complete len:319 (-),score=153.84 TRINITY_DN1439_c1_g1_i1:238-1194(-)